MKDDLLDNELQAKEFYDYWVSRSDPATSAEELDMPKWALDILFVNTNRETGLIDGQDTNVVYHGTTQNLLDLILSEGLRAREGSACFTRNIGHALERYAVMGNFSMITNGSVNEAIEALADQKLISDKSQALSAFEYWCRDDQREKLGLLTIWEPPKSRIALDCKNDKTYKKHLALYEPKPDQAAAERRSGLNEKPGHHIFLEPKYLLATVKPSLGLRLCVAELSRQCTEGKNILEQSAQLTDAIENALIYKSKTTQLETLSDSILATIAESSLLSLVRQIVDEKIAKKDPSELLDKLERVTMPIEYLEQYRLATIKALKLI